MMALQALGWFVLIGLLLTVVSVAGFWPKTWARSSDSGAGLQDLADGEGAYSLFSKPLD